MTDKRLLVYVDLEGKALPVGQLWARNNRGKESASFEYRDAWLKHPSRFPLEPALTLGKGAFHTAAGRSIFGAIGDSAPDRWGRMLMQREQRRQARVESRAPRTLSEADYLLGVSDIARQGALRFCEKEGEPFLAEKAQIPPLVKLPKLLRAAIRVSADDGDGDDHDDDDLRILLAPGSSLGGARPKASVVDRDGHLAIAKFPKHDDAYRIGKWEAVALSLAANAGIQVSEWRLEDIAGRDVILLRRFDRKDNRRIPFLSAMSMLGAADNETHSYPEIADALRQYGSKPEDDCAQLWRRMVFNILISNTDDHLRNHGFLYEKGVWRLSPAYDLNPVPVDIKQRVLNTAIDEEDGTASLELALKVAAQFRLKLVRAKEIIREGRAAVSKWHVVAAKTGLKPSEIERMSSAFEHEELKVATH